MTSNHKNNHLDTSVNDNQQTWAGVAPVSDDWYHGHKVVAMPSSAFGGMSIREVVSSRNNDAGDNNNGHSRPRRSNSLGRQPTRPGRDIVQDVYDRMGVSYSRGMHYEASSNNHMGGSSRSHGYDQQFQDPSSNTAVNNNAVIQQQPSFSDTSELGGSTTGSTSMRSSGNSNCRNSMTDKFSGRYRAAAAVTRSTGNDRNYGRTTRPSDNYQDGNQHRAAEPRAVEPRGRPRETEESEGQRRARSLSKGRSVHGRWPPSKEETSQSNNRNPTSIPTSNYGVPVGSASESHAAKLHHPDQDPPPPARLLKRSHSFDARPQYKTGGYRRASENHNMNSHKHEEDMGASLQDEKKENDEGSVSSELSGPGDAKEVPSMPSIKDRISAFAGKSRQTKRSSTSPPSYIKTAPPKVDIYGQERQSFPNSEAQQQQQLQHPDDPAAFDYTEETAEPSSSRPEDYAQSQGPPEPSSVPPSAAASAAADVAAKYMRPSQMVASKKAANRRGSSIANSYLSGIQTTNSSNSASSRSCFQQTVPISSVPSTGMEEDACSFDADSSAREGRRWSKADSYNSTKPSSQRSTNTESSAGNNLVSAAMIEKMIDERVQTQLREVEVRMEGMLRRWMDQMNTKITTRLDAMEMSIKESIQANNRHYQAGREI